MNEAVMIFVWTAGSHTAKAESQAGGSRTCVHNGRKVEPHGRRAHVHTAAAAGVEEMQLRA